ncbi:Gfo/Idh/MocA family oxidoreductase [Klebsiella quasipneumoniae]|uniref:Gfo/Idh/MocA family oxidoreductase n=1 Tax=Klebsiella quasipneumoniae TaxID=1463165 RepID=UPI003C729773
MALPNHLHYTFAVKALESGKHVIIEKPIVIDVAELLHMVLSRLYASVRKTAMRLCLQRFRGKWGALLSINQQIRWLDMS